MTPDDLAVIRARSVGERMALREILGRARAALATPYRPLKSDRQQLVDSIDALASGSTAHTDLSRLLDALEAAETDRDALRAELKRYHEAEAARLQAELELYHNAARTWTEGRPFRTEGEAT